MDAKKVVDRYFGNIDILKSIGKAFRNKYGYSKYTIIEETRETEEKEELVQKTK